MLKIVAGSGILLRFDSDALTADIISSAQLSSDKIKFATAMHYTAFVPYSVTAGCSLTPQHSRSAAWTLLSDHGYPLIQALFQALQSYSWGFVLIQSLSEQPSNYSKGLFAGPIFFPRVMEGAHDRSCLSLPVSTFQSFPRLESSISF